MACEQGADAGDADPPVPASSPAAAASVLGACSSLHSFVCAAAGVCAVAEGSADGPSLHLPRIMIPRRPLRICPARRPASPSNPPRPLLLTPGSVGADDRALESREEDTPLQFERAPSATTDGAPRAPARRILSSNARGRRRRCRASHAADQCVPRAAQGRRPSRPRTRWRRLQAARTRPRPPHRRQLRS